MKSENPRTSLHHALENPSKLFKLDQQVGMLDKVREWWSKPVEAETQQPPETLEEMLIQRHNSTMIFISQVHNLYPFSVVRSDSDDGITRLRAAIDDDSWFTSEIVAGSSYHVFQDLRGCVAVEFRYNQRGQITSMTQTTVTSPNTVSQFTIEPRTKTITTTSIFPVVQDPSGTEANRLWVQGSYQKPFLQKTLQEGLELQEVTLISASQTQPDAAIFDYTERHKFNISQNALARYRRSRLKAGFLSKQEDSSGKLPDELQMDIHMLSTYGPEYQQEVHAIPMPPSTLYVGSFMSEHDIPLLQAHALLNEAPAIRSLYIAIQAALEEAIPAIPAFQKWRKEVGPHIRARFVSENGDILIDGTTPMQTPEQHMLTMIVQLRKIITTLIEQTPSNSFNQGRLQQVINYFTELVHTTQLGYGELCRLFWHQCQHNADKNTLLWDYLNGLYAQYNIQIFNNFDPMDTGLIKNTLDMLDDKTSEQMFASLGSVLDTTITQPSSISISQELDEKMKTVLPGWTALMDLVLLLRTQTEIPGTEIKSAVAALFPQDKTALTPQQMKIYMLWTRYVFAEDGPFYKNKRTFQMKDTMTHFWTREMLAQLTNQLAASGRDLAIEEEWIHTVIKTGVTDDWEGEIYKGGLHVLGPLEDYATRVPENREVVRQYFLRIASSFWTSNYLYKDSLGLLNLDYNEAGQYNEESLNRLKDILMEYEAVFFQRSASSRFSFSAKDQLQYYTTFLNVLASSPQFQRVIQSRIAAIRAYMNNPNKEHPYNNSKIVTLDTRPVIQDAKEQVLLALEQLERKFNL